MNVFLKKYPEISDIVHLTSQHTFEHIYHLQKEENHHLEIEVRLGRYQLYPNPRFVPGVSSDFFNWVVELLQTQTWKSDSDWFLSQSTFYDIPNPSIQKREKKLTIRTTVDYINDQKKINITHVRKHLLNKLTFKYENKTQSFFDKRDGFDMRVSFQVEEEIDQKLIPHSVQPNFVRLCEKRIFITENGDWMFVVNKVWSGYSIHETEANMLSTQPVFEIEVECVDPEKYTSTLKENPLRSPLYGSTSLLLKVVQMIKHRCNTSQFIYQHIHK